MPTLYIVAGCNGAGKSETYKSIVPEGLESFDFDLCYKKHFDLSNNENESLIAARNEFMEAIEKAADQGADFSYQTNFDQHPLAYYNEFFLDSDYKLALIFVSVASIEIAIRRVGLRVLKGGHNVPPELIKSKYKKGFKNLDFFYSFFDLIVLFENSVSNQKPSLLLIAEKKEIKFKSKKIPRHLRDNAPLLCKTYFNVGESPIG